MSLSVVVLLSLVTAGTTAKAFVDDRPSIPAVYVQLSVIGKADSKSGTVTAMGKPDRGDARFAIDFSRSPHLRDEFSKLDGQTIQMRGTYLRCTDDGEARTPRCNPKVSSTGLFLQPVSVKEFTKPDGDVSAKDHTVMCVCRGKLNTGILALGGETTGFTIDITDDGTTSWELDLDSRDRDRADSLSDQLVIVSGKLFVRKGVAVSDRWIVQVRTLATR